MKVTKQAIDAIEQTAKEVLRWPDNRKWNSVDKDERFRASAKLLRIEMENYPINMKMGMY